jgi:hypothetical protein
MKQKKTKILSLNKEIVTQLTLVQQSQILGGSTIPPQSGIQWTQKTVGTK